jgi:hypothetical protein
MSHVRASDVRSLGRRRRAGLLIAAAVAAASPVAARAVDAFYIGPTGLWSDPTNWQSSVLPGAGDVVNLVQSGSSSITVTFDNTATSATFGTILTDSTGGVMTFNQVTNSLTVTLERIGVDGVGVANLMAGTHTVVGTGSNGLFVGFNEGSNGTLNLGGAAVKLTDSIYVGYSGVGVVNHTAGSLTLNGYLSLGGEPTGTLAAGTGTYNFSGGTISAAGTYVGLTGYGEYHQSGGNATLADMEIGYLPGSGGLVTLSAGTLFVGSAVTVGDQGDGSFQQTGGTHTNGSMVVGSAAGVTGTYTLSAGTLNVQTSEVIGSLGSGLMTQTGGTHSADSLFAAIGPSATASIALSGASSSLSVNSVEYIGFNGQADFTQSGGTHTVGSHLELGHYGNGWGTYSITDGSLSTRSISVGYGSALDNQFVQGGGTVTASDYITLGDQSGAKGTYTLTAGSLSVDTLFTAWMGNGTYNQSGGSATFDAMFVGHEGGSRGSVNLTGGSINTTTADVGYGGSGTVVQSAGSLMASGAVTISGTAGGAGTYRLSGGTFGAGSVANNGTYLQTGGAATVAGMFSGSGVTTIGGGTLSTTLSAGSLNVNSITVTNNGRVALFAGTSRVASAVNTLALAGNGTLDVGSNNVQLDRGTLPANAAGSVVRNTYQSIIAAYNSPNPLLVVGDWNGSGVTSALAKADVALPLGQRKGLAVGIWDSTDPQIATKQPAGTVVVATTVLGDANGDGFTDNADYAIWRNNYGTRNTYWSHGDYNYDGFIDNADYAIWRNNYGNRAKLGAVSTAGSVGGSTPSAAAALAGPVTLTGKAAAASSGGTASPALSPFPTSVPAGQVAINIDPNTGDVLVDINLQGQSDLQGVQFASLTNNAFLPANYQGMQAHGFSPAWVNSGPSQTATLIGEINQNGQTSFPSEVVLDFGRFWSTATNARDIQFTYNTVASDMTNSNVGTVTYIAVPEPSALGLAALAAAGLLGKRRRRSA